MHGFTGEDKTGGQTPPVSDENIAESARFLFLPMSEYAEILLYHAV